VVLKPQRSCSPEYHFPERFSEPALVWFSLSLEHWKISENYALRVILLNRVPENLK
jgi:hypothetical protein